MTGLRLEAEATRLAGSVLCVGFPGATPAEVALDELSALGPGGIVLFGRNVRTPQSTLEVVETVCAAVAARTETRPLVAIDQEGGRVARLRDGAHEIPSAMALGAAGDPQLAERVGRLVAYDLRLAGVDVDFAPVLDLALAPESSAIGARSFGDDPDRVAELGCAFARGLEAGGVTATFKHFPGHGAAVLDSHDTLPAIESDEFTLRARDFVPFARAIANGARAVMSAHVVVRVLDPTRPATLSPRIMTGLLRDEFGFTGACFSDDLEMAAVAEHGGLARGAVDALLAGIDGLIVSHDLGKARIVRDAVAAALSDGTLAESRVRTAAERLRALPRGRVSAGVVDVEAGREAARRAIAVIRNAGAIPLDAGRPVTVVSFEGETFEGAQGRHADFASLSHALRVRGIRSELMRVPLDPNGEMIDTLVALCEAQRGRQFALVARRAHVHPAQRVAIVKLLAIAPQAVLVCAREPFEAGMFDSAETVVCSFGDESIAIDALADVLRGRFKAIGVLPVRVNGLDR